MTMQQSDMERYNPLLMLKEVMAQTLDWPPESPDNQYHLNK